MTIGDCQVCNPMKTRLSSAGLHCGKELVKSRAPQLRFCLSAAAVAGAVACFCIIALAVCCLLCCWAGCSALLY